MKRFRALSSRWILQLHPHLRHQLAAFGSQLTLNLSLFGILFAASLLLEPAEFVRLSIANTYIFLLSTFLDFGLNNASLKLSIENRQRHFVNVNVVLKGGLFLISLVILVITAALIGPVREVIIFSGAAGISFWSATRVLDQYERRFLSYSVLNLVLAANRIVFGCLSLLTKSWMMIALAVHVVSLLPIQAATLSRMSRQWTAFKGSFQRNEITMLRRIAPLFFLGQVFFASIPVIVQTAIYLSGNTAATGGFGIVLLLLGPIALLTATMRIYLQPQVLLGSLDSVDIFGLGRGSFHIVVGAYAGLLLAGIVPTSFVVQWVYQERFPEVGSFLLVYAGTSCLVTALGFYNMRCLRGDLFWIAFAVNALRAALTAPLLVLPQIGALAMVTWSALVLLLGELLLMWLLTFAARPGDASCGKSESA